MCFCKFDITKNVKEEPDLVSMFQNVVIEEISSDDEDMLEAFIQTDDVDLYAHETLELSDNSDSDTDIEIEDALLDNVFRPGMSLMAVYSAIDSYSELFVETIYLTGLAYLNTITNRGFWCFACHFRLNMGPIESPLKIEYLCVGPAAEELLNLACDKVFDAIDGGYKAETDIFCCECNKFLLTMVTNEEYFCERMYLKLVEGYRIVNCVEPISIDEEVQHNSTIADL